MRTVDERRQIFFGAFATRWAKAHARLTLSPRRVLGGRADLASIGAVGTPNVFKSATETDAQAARRWRGVIRRDRARMKASTSQKNPFRKTGGGRRDPEQGFLNLHKDLVVALRDDACLAWGAVDFGEGDSGDIMHFDARVGALGDELARVGDNFPTTAGHPCVT